MGLTKSKDRASVSQQHIEVKGVPAEAFKANVMYSCGCTFITDNMDDAVKHCYETKHSMIVQGFIKSLHRKEEKKKRSQRFAETKDGQYGKEQHKRGQSRTSKPKDSSDASKEEHSPSESFSSMRERLKRNFATER